MFIIVNHQTSQITLPGPRGFLGSAISRLSGPSIIGVFNNRPGILDTLIHDHGECKGGGRVPIPGQEAFFMPRRLCTRLEEQE